MCHDQTSHQPRAYPPRSRIHILKFIIFIREFYIKGLCKVLTEVVGSSRLKCLKILHHWFKSIGLNCTCKFFMFRFFSFVMIHCHKMRNKIWIHFHHFSRFNIGFFSCSMSRMSFLPEKFCTPEENSRSHLPSHHICPLIYKEWQITMWFNPISITISDNRFWSWSDNQLFLQFRLRIYDNPFAIFIIFQPIVRHDRTFFGKSLYMVCFFTKKRFWDKKWEVGILMPGCLKHRIKHISNIFPDRVSIRFNHHTPSYRGVFS